MDCSLNVEEKRSYAAWLHSPSVSSRTPGEGIIAFKIGRILGAPPSRILKALRGVDGVDPRVRETVERFVADDPTLGFSGEPPLRLVGLVAASCRGTP